LDGRHRQRTGGSIGLKIVIALEQGHQRLLTCVPGLPGLDPVSTSGSAVSTVARNLFDSLNFRHDTRQDTRGLPFGTIQGLPDPDKHCLQKGNLSRGARGRACPHPNASSKARPRSKRLGGGITFTPCTLVRSAAVISAEIAMPSSAAASTLDARLMRSSIADGTCTPGTSFARYSASSTFSKGRRLNTIGRRASSSRR